MTVRRVELDAGAPRVTLTVDVLDTIAAALTDASATTVVIAGRSGVFCEGLDLEVAVDAMDSGEADALVPRYAKILSAIERCPRPVIATVDGTVLGGGVGLAAACDIVLATETSTFALPETLIGLIPAAVLPLLVQRVGAANARRLALGIAPIAADEALRIGLVDNVVSDLEREVRSRASRFKRLDPHAIEAVKTLCSEHHGIDEAMSRSGQSVFAGLLRREETQSRLRRAARGESPWETTE